MAIFKRISTALCLILLCASIVTAGDLDGKIRAAGSDIKVFCPALDVQDIQWTALIHLNRVYGAEIYIGLIHPSPEFGLRIISTEDGQFHLAHIGYPVETDAATLADSISDRLFGGIYPDLAIFEANNYKDSLFLTSVLSRISQVSRTDTLAMASLERIFVRGDNDIRADVILNDRELFDSYSPMVKTVADRFQAGSIRYRPEQYRKYYRLDAPVGTVAGQGGFLSGTSRFRLPDIISETMFEGPEKNNLLSRLDRYRNDLQAASLFPTGSSDQIKLLATAYREIARLVRTLEAGTNPLSSTRTPEWAHRLQQKAYLALSEALGIDWNGRLVLRRTPFGQTTRLVLDLQLTGASEVELSYFRFHPHDQPVVIIDSISTLVMPHQRFYREYPLDLTNIDLESMGENRYSIEVIVEGLSLNLYVSYSEHASEDVAVAFLPGFTFLAPFDEGNQTSLAQTFDWQLMITKPFGSELDGRLKINTPDGIVVGSFDKNVFMPVGVTRKYMNIYLAAGRSLGYDQREVTASLEVGGQVMAQTAANVRVIRCKIPETRDIGFVPDADGRVEDFLRMARVSFQPFTPNSLVRASLEAYDLIIIGADVSENHDLLRTVRDRLNQFVNDGGEILVLGQDFGLIDVFDFPIYAAQSSSGPKASLKLADHRLVNQPYDIRFKQLNASLQKYGSARPAIIDAGTEIISAGEQGSLLRVAKVGDGHIIYCGLPLLELAAELNVEAIHLLANLLNFGHGN